MADGYGIPETDTIKMFGDAHNTNWAENYQFFMNQNNPTNFERVWRQAYYLYKRIGSIENSPVPFDSVMDFSIIAKLGKEQKYASQKDEYAFKLTPKTVSEIKAESDEILTNTVVIHFYPNSWDLHYKVTKQINGKDVQELYDPSVDAILEEIAKLTEQFGAARVVIEGHTDSSMKGQVPGELGERSLSKSSQLGQGSISGKVQPGSQQVFRGRHGLGQAGRFRRSNEPGKESPGGNQSLSRRKTIVCRNNQWKKLQIIIRQRRWPPPKMLL